MEKPTQKGGKGSAENAKKGNGGTPGVMIRPARPPKKKK